MTLSDPEWVDTLQAVCLAYAEGRPVAPELPPGYEPDDLAAMLAALALGAMGIPMTISTEDRIQ